MVGESRFGGITKGGFFGLMLVGGLVIGLFFLPEFLQIWFKAGAKKANTSGVTAQLATVDSNGSQNSEKLSTEPLTIEDATQIRKKEAQRLQDQKSANIDAVLAANEAESPSYVSESVSNNSFSATRSKSGLSIESRSANSDASTWGWWRDLKNWFSGLSAPRLAQRTGPGSSDSVRNSDDERASFGNVSQRLDGARPGQISWASIRAPESKDAISQARRDALELSRGLPANAKAAKFAMIDFANGLDFVLTRADQQMTPREAVTYLMNLEQSVGRALVDDNVERVYVKRWSQISLGPVLSKTMLGQAHQSDVLPFDPQLTMTSIAVIHKGMKRGDPTTGKVQVTISGYLIGDDIKSVTMEANDAGISHKLSLMRDPRGFWFFNRGSIDARQTWIFKVYDKFGERYQKMYRFYPKTGQFVYEKGRGYKLPFRMTRATVGTFRAQDFDPALDKYFTVAQSQDASIDPNALFVTF